MDAITAEGLVKVYKSRKSEVHALDGLDLTATLRELWGNPSPVPSGSFPSQEPVVVTLGWVVVIVAVFGTLGIRRYRSLNM
jgi:hypothetical protein